MRVVPPLTPISSTRCSKYYAGRGHQSGRRRRGGEQSNRRVGEIFGYDPYDTLQAAIGRASNPQVRDRIETAVEDLDETIREIRTAILGLHHRSPHPAALRDAVLAATAEATRVLGFSPAVRFDGPVENAVPAAVGEALVAVLQEALSNVARHARATRVDVDVRRWQISAGPAGGTVVQWSVPLNELEAGHG
jgi:hypothetical protein